MMACNLKVRMDLYHEQEYETSDGELFGSGGLEDSREAEKRVS
jgi:hypothetical protein